MLHQIGSNTYIDPKPNDMSDAKQFVIDSKIGLRWTTLGTWSFLLSEFQRDAHVVAMTGN